MHVYILLSLCFIYFLFSVSIAFWAYRKEFSIYGFVLCILLFPTTHFSYSLGMVAGLIFGSDAQRRSTEPIEVSFLKK